ncbi:MAG TPA: chloride channel protein [Verrucomicrobiota bacterium]|nr:chloride channel protein [Verrucomicrobiota bacterium]HNU49658.1 chloride channel protein [Verrucomicrobiota bacterium]
MNSPAANRNLWRVITSRLPPRSRAVLQTSVLGLGAGAAAVAFQLGINALFRGTFVSLSTQSGTVFLLGSLGVIVGSALGVGWLLYSFCREASGSGIPQLKAAFWKDFGYVPWRVAWVKFTAGILSVGGGSSLGREGPSVQLAGAVASGLGGLMGEPKQNRRLAAAAGAAAGLAAAFNTPLAAVTFVLEEIVQDLNSRILGSVLLASLLGAFVVHGVIGKQPSFSLSAVEPSGWLVYLFVPLVAAAAALVGVGFQRATLALRDQRQHRALVILPLWLRPTLGAVLTWALGAAVFLHTGRLGVFGLGYEDLSAGLANELSWYLAGILLVAKFLATVGCYGFGGCGGIFSPTLFFGGMCGLALGGLAGLVTHLSAADQVVLAVVGMSACLGAVVRAPITGILIVFEMTHEFGLVPALMLGALVSQAISHRLLQHSFYDALLAQDGHRVEHLVPPRDLAGWRQRPVSALATGEPVMAQSLNPEAIQKLLRDYPYERFPVYVDGLLQGILTRAEVRAARTEGRAPRLAPAVCCLPSSSVREVQRLLLESPAGLVVVREASDGTPVGVVTLHDLLRAEISLESKAATD